MEEIKLRAWNPETEQMAYFEPFKHVYNCEGNTVLEAQKIDDGDYSEGGFYSNEVIMLCTGLKDSNGREAYDDDLWRAFKGAPLYLVHWIPENAGFSMTCIETEGQGVGSILNMYHLQNGDIVGNIHENPELLKGEG